MNFEVIKMCIKNAQTKKATKTISISLDKKTLDELAFLAKKRRISLNTMVIEIINLISADVLPKKQEKE